MIPIVFLLISIILDGILTNFLPYLVNDLSYLTPLLTVVTIFLIYPFYLKKIKYYFITVFITGIIYDLFYTNLLFFNGVIFVLVGLISFFIHKNFETNYFKLLLYLLIIIISYELLNAIILYIYNIVPVTIDKVIYKIIHSIFINIIYGELLFIIIKKISKKYRWISIN